MHDNIHLMIATSTSMIITFLIHSLLEYIPSTQSFLQRYFIDFIHDFSLAARCQYNQGIRNLLFHYHTFLLLLI